MTEDAQHNYTPPEGSASDHGHALARAGIGSIPLVGAAATELFQALITPPLEKRRQEWMETIGAALQQLEQAGTLQLEDLSQNEAFIDTVMQASQTALRNSQQEKRDALRNAIINSALPSAPDESRQQMFVNLIDEMTVWHLRILYFFANPTQWFEEHAKEAPRYTMSSSLSQILITAYPELGNQRGFYDQIGKDLHRRGLLGTDGFHAMMSATGAYENRATELGQEFLNFIAKPE